LLRGIWVKNPYLGAGLSSAVDLADPSLLLGTGGKAAGVAGTIAKKEMPAILKEIDTAEKAVALKGAERENYLNALNEFFGSKSKRAEDMGFDPKTWFHGGPSDLNQLKTSKQGSFGPGIYVTNSKDAAQQYADKASGSVYNLKLKNQEPLNFDDAGEIFSEKMERVRIITVFSKRNRKIFQKKINIRE